MRVITAIGEQGLTHPDGREVVFRPSLYAMSQLGTPKEIVELFAAIHEPPRLVESMSFDTEGQKAAAERINVKAMKDHWLHMLFLSWQVMYACADVDPAPFIGEPGSRYRSYRLGLVDPEVMLVIARSLLRHGLVGPTAQRTPEELKEAAEQHGERRGMVEFDALEYVSKAVTHLGLSESEAWNMTITSFGAHWAAKYGEHKEKRHSTEHDQTMRWLAAVNKVRDAKK